MSSDGPEAKQPKAAVPRFNPHIDEKIALKKIKLDGRRAPDLKSLGCDTEDDLFQAIADTLAANIRNQDATFYLKQIDRHVGKNATHGNIKIMKRYCRYIFFRIKELDKIIKDSRPGDQQYQQACSDRNSILDQLGEGINQCTDGYVNRLFDLQRSLRIPKTIDGLLTNYRVSLIEKVFLRLIAEIKTDPTIAMKVGLEVHLKRECYNLANKIGYNVPIPPFEDIYTPQAGDANSYIAQFQGKISRRLRLALVDQYTPWHMISICREQITQQAGYRGHNKKGYKAYTYNKIIANIKAYLPNEDESKGSKKSEAKETTEDDFLVTTQTDRVIDIDLKKLTKNLWEHFQKQKYFVFPNERPAIEPVTIGHSELCYYTSLHPLASIVSFKIKGDEKQAAPLQTCFLPDLPVDDFGSDTTERLGFLNALLTKVPSFKDDIAAIFSLSGHMDLLNRIQPDLALFITTQYFANANPDKKELISMIKATRGKLKIRLAKELFSLREKEINTGKDVELFEFLYQAFEHDKDARKSLIFSMGLEEIFTRCERTKKHEAQVLKILAIISPFDSKKLFEKTNSRAFWLGMIDQRLTHLNEKINRKKSPILTKEMLRLFYHYSPDEKFEFLMRTYKSIDFRRDQVTFILNISIGISDPVLAKKATQQMFEGLTIAQKCQLLDCQFSSWKQTFLMIAASKKIPGIMMVLLDGLPFSDRFERLMQQDSQKMIVFMFAALYMPSHIPDIDRLSTIREQMQQRQHRDYLKDTALMLVVKKGKNPAAIPFILNPLSISNRMIIQREKTSKGETSLILAVKSPSPEKQIRAQLVGLPTNMRVMLLCDKDSKNETAMMMLTGKKGKGLRYLALLQGLSYRQRRIIEAAGLKDNDPSKKPGAIFQSSFYLKYYLTLGSLIESLTVSRWYSSREFTSKWRSGSSDYYYFEHVTDIWPIFAIADYENTDIKYLKFLRSKFKGSRRKNSNYNSIRRRYEERLGYCHNYNYKNYNLAIEYFEDSKSDANALRSLLENLSNLKMVHVFLKSLYSMRKYNNEYKTEDDFFKEILESRVQIFCYNESTKDTLNTLLTISKDNGVEIQANRGGLDTLIELMTQSKPSVRGNPNERFIRFRAACSKKAQSDSEEQQRGRQETKESEPSLGSLKAATACFKNVNSRLADDIIEVMHKIGTDSPQTAGIFDHFIAFAYPGSIKTDADKSEKKGNSTRLILKGISQLFSKATPKYKTTLVGLLRRNENLAAHVLAAGAKAGMPFLCQLKSRHLKQLLKNNPSRAMFIRLIFRYILFIPEALIKNSESFKKDLVTFIKNSQTLMAGLKADEFTNFSLDQRQGDYTLLSEIMSAGRDVFKVVLPEFTKRQLMLLCKQSNGQGQTPLMWAAIHDIEIFVMLLDIFSSDEKNELLSQPILGKPQESTLDWITKNVPQMLHGILKTLPLLLNFLTVSKLFSTDKRLKFGWMKIKVFVDIIFPLLNNVADPEISASTIKLLCSDLIAKQIKCRVSNINIIKEGSLLAVIVNSSQLTTTGGNSERKDVPPGIPSRLFKQDSVDLFLKKCTGSVENKRIYEEKIKIILPRFPTSGCTAKQDDAVCLQLLREILEVAKSNTLLLRFDNRGFDLLSKLCRHITLCYKLAKKPEAREGVINQACKEIAAKNLRDNEDQCSQA